MAKRDGVVCSLVFALGLFHVISFGAKLKAVFSGSPPYIHKAEGSDIQHFPANVEIRDLSHSIDSFTVARRRPFPRRSESLNQRIPLSIGRRHNSGRGSLFFSFEYFVPILYTNPLNGLLLDRVPIGDGVFRTPRRDSSVKLHLHGGGLPRVGYQSGKLPNGEGFRRRLKELSRLNAFQLAIGTREILQSDPRPLLLLKVVDSGLQCGAGIFFRRLASLLGSTRLHLQLSDSVANTPVYLCGARREISCSLRVLPSSVGAYLGGRDQFIGLLRTRVSITPSKKGEYHYRASEYKLYDPVGLVLWEGFPAFLPIAIAFVFIQMSIFSLYVAMTANMKSTIRYLHLALSAAGIFGLYGSWAYICNEGAMKHEY